MLSFNISDIAIITVKNIDYCCIIHNISKSEAINLLENSVLEDRGYLSKNIVLNFQSGFLLFLLSIYKMVDNMDTKKSLNINIKTIMKNPEILKFIPDHFKTKHMCNYAVKKLPFVIRYVPDQYKTKKMCNRVILEKGGTLKSAPNRYKTKEMCNKAVDNYAHALEFVSDRYKTQEMCIKAVDNYPYTIKFVPD